MRLLYRDGRKVLHVLVVAELPLQIVDDIGIFLLEHVGEDTVLWLSVLVVYTVMIHLVDKEQGQHLDALIEELPLTLDVGEDGFPYLDTAQLVLVHLANHVSSVKLDAVDEFDGVVSAIDALHDETVPILRKFT
jgi:hypothetical protein